MTLTRKALRAAVWVRAGGRCEVATCRRRVDRANWEAHVHHKIYRDHGVERLEDLELRCLACHARRHPHHTFLTRAQQAVRRRRRRRRTGARASDADRGLTRDERRALRWGAGRWAWRPPDDDGGRAQHLGTLDDEELDHPVLRVVR